MENDKNPVVVTSDSPFFGDKLNRAAVADYLKKYLIGKHKISQENNLHRSFVLNINSPWGVGKTYFLSEWKKLLSKDGHLTVYFDAWANDYSEQPIIGLMSEIESQLSQQLPAKSKARNQISKVVSQSSKLIKATIPHIAVAVLKAATKIDLNNVDIQDALTSKEFLSDAEKITDKAKENLYKENQKTKQAITGFKEALTKLLGLAKEDFQLPIFIFVDELDRCRPTFSIQLLEDIKHLFGIDDIYFIIATDSTQLAHSIKAVYGNDFDGGMYLQRFFDQEFSLPDPDRFNYSCHLFSKYKLDNEPRFFSALDHQAYPSTNLNVKIFSLFADAFGLSLRAMDQACVVLDAIRITSTEKIHVGFLTFAIMLRIIQPSLFERISKKTLEMSEAFVNLKGIFSHKIQYDYLQMIDNFTSEKTSSPLTAYINVYISITSQTYDQVMINYNSSADTGRLIRGQIMNNQAQFSLLSEYPNLVRSAAGLIQKI